MNHDSAPVPSLRSATPLVTTYAVVSVATLALLAVLAALAPAQATTDAWVHAAIVAAFAGVLTLRLRAARRGSARARRAIGVISVVLVVVNVVEALLPGAFPAWMRWEMVLLALLMAAVAVLVRRPERR